MSDLPFAFIYPWRVEGRQTPFHPWAHQSFQRHLRTAVAEAKRQKAAAKFYATRVRINDHHPEEKPVIQNPTPDTKAPTLAELMEQGYSAEQGGIHIAFADAMVGRDLAQVIPVVLIALENVALAALPIELRGPMAQLMRDAADRIAPAPDTFTSPTTEGYHVPVVDRMTVPAETNDERVIETRHYADGSSATGPAPLPDESPIERGLLQ